MEFDIGASTNKALLKVKPARCGIQKDIVDFILYMFALGLNIMGHQ